MSSIITKFNGTEIIGDNELLKPYKSLSVPWVNSMHRGYSSATVAENTMAAFHRAYLNGANCIETDARRSSDGEYIISHDATITVNGTTYTVANETAETLTSLVLSTDLKYGQCKVATIRDLLTFCVYTGMMVNIDCKSVDHTALAELVVECGMSGKTIYAASTAYALTILSTDPNAGFVFPYNSLSTYDQAEAFSDKRVRGRSYAYSSSISQEAVKNAKALGFNYLVSETHENNYASKVAYMPDMVEFQTRADCKTITKDYIDSLVLI